jgi:hypothetical protein
MAKTGKRIVVAKGRATVQKEQALIESAKDTLRSLKPLGVRFSVTEQDGGETTIEAWVDAPAAPKPPRAASAPAASAGGAPAAQGGTDAAQGEGAE